MNPEQSQPGVPWPQHRFFERCAALGLAAWHFDAAGALVGATAPGGLADAGPGGPEAAADAARVTAVACAWCGQDQPQPVELPHGRRLLPFAFSHGSRHLGLVAVLEPRPGAAAGLGPPDTDSTSAGASDPPRQSVRAGAGLEPAGPGHLETVLAWSREDLVGGARAERTLAEFSDQLAHAYEELSLLYALGRSMNCIHEPHRFVKLLCKQLHENLPFRWVAVRFGRDRGSVPRLEGSLELAGTLPAEPARFAELVDGLLDRVADPAWDRLMAADAPGLGALVGAEVLASPIRHDGQVVGMLVAGNKGGPDPDVSSVETKLVDAAADFLAVYYDNTARYHQLHALFLGMLRALSAAIDAKDHYTRGHSERVALLAALLAEAAGLDAELVERYRIAGLVHDVGKIGIRGEVLRKPGRLSEAEFSHIQQHPVIGHAILKAIPQLADVLPGVLHHHERWDGRGYPAGLAGAQIPLIGRVIAVADTFDAMSSTRSYRPARPRAMVLEESRRCASTQFDPDIVKLLTQIDLTEYDRLLSAPPGAGSEAA